MTAEVIPFRRRHAASDAPDGTARLLQALSGLEAALAEQRAAIAEWRQSLAALQTTVRGVGEGLQRYRGSLDQLNTEVTALNGQAVRLEQWADTALAALPPTLPD